MYSVVKWILLPVVRSIKRSSIRSVHPSYRGWLFSQTWSRPRSHRTGCSGWTTGGYQCPCWSATWTRSPWSSSPGSAAPGRQSCSPRSPWLGLRAPSLPSRMFVSTRENPDFHVSQLTGRRGTECVMVNLRWPIFLHPSWTWLCTKLCQSILKVPTLYRIHFINVFKQ